jgi:phospholipid transport system substrate-binding protein
MFRRRQPAYRSIAFGLVVILAAAATAAGRADAATNAGDFLVSFGQRAVKEINDTSLSEAERERRFRELFNEAVDVPAIGKFILGPHWRRATARERADFLAVFEDIALQRFLPMFTRQTDEYAGKSFDIVEVRRAENNREQVFVRALVAREQGAPVRLIWRIRERNDEFKILDISAEGLSMALTLRQEYNSAIKRTGGVGGLVALLRSKVRAGAFAPKFSAGTR